MMIAFMIAAAFAAQDGPPESEELRGYLVEAAENHPRLRSQYETWLASLDAVPQAKALDDPMLSYTQFVQSEVNNFRAHIAQKFPWFGTRKTRARKAEAEAEAKFFALCAERNRVLADVTKAYFEYAYLGDQVRVTESQAEILTYTEETATAKFALGLTGEVDLLRVQTEQIQLDDRYKTLLAARPAASARLALAVGRPPGDVLPWPAVSALPDDAPPAPVLAARLRAVNPELQAMDQMIAAAESGEALARKKGYPDITLGVEYGGISKPRKIRPERPSPMTLNTLDKFFMTNSQNARTALGQLATGQPLTPPARVPGNPFIDAYTLATRREPFVTSNGGEDNIAITLGFNLPIWRGKVRAGVAEAKHNAAAAEHRQTAHALALEEQVRLSHFELMDAKRRYRVVDEQLVPQARRTYESLQTAYASGEIGADFLDVLESIQTLLDFELERARAFRDAHVAAAELERIVDGFPDVPKPGP